MKNRINPLGRTVLAAAALAVMVGAVPPAFAQYGHDNRYGYGDDHDYDRHDNDHRRPPAYYQPGYVYRAPPPVVYAPPSPQYAPPLDLFFSFSFR